MTLAATDTETILIPNLVLAADGRTVSIRRDVMHEALFADCSEQIATEAIARFTPGEPVAVPSTPVRLTQANFGRIPTMVSPNAACSI